MGQGPYGWEWFGQGRPDFAVEPGDGQESVWDYPRPPRLRPEPRRVVVAWNGEIVADTSDALALQETASPPTIYLPPRDVRTGLLVEAGPGSHCEWKGPATYWDVVVGHDTQSAAAWNYPRPKPAYRDLAGWFSFYPARFECTVGGERVLPQPGGFYGGWITPELVGPFKGEPGTSHW